MTLRDRLLDVAVYAPAGILASVLEDLPGLVTKGRDQIEGIEGQVRSARGIGELTVAFGRQQVERRLTGLFPHHGPAQSGTAAPPRDVAAPGPGTPASPPFGTEPGAGKAGPNVQSGAPGDAGPVPPPAGAADAAIAGYDTLSASQVVRRLDGLGADELDAVYRHEAAGRGRRTILHRIQQLQSGDAGPAEPTGPADPPAPS